MGSGASRSKAEIIESTILEHQKLPDGIDGAEAVKIIREAFRAEYEAKYDEAGTAVLNAENIELKAEIAALREKLAEKEQHNAEVSLPPALRDFETISAIPAVVEIAKSDALREAEAAVYQAPDDPEAAAALEALVQKRSSVVRVARDEHECADASTGGTPTFGNGLLLAVHLADGVQFSSVTIAVF